MNKEEKSREIVKRWLLYTDSTLEETEKRFITTMKDVFILLHHVLCYTEA